MGDDDTALRPEFGQAAGHGLVVAEDAVAMQLDPFGEAARDVIEGKRPLHMARDLHSLPGGKVFVNLAARFADLLFHRFHFRIEIDVVLVGMDFSSWSRRCNSRIGFSKSSGWDSIVSKSR